jgi:hypothetical protein
LSAPTSLSGKPGNCSGPRSGSTSSARPSIPPGHCPIWPFKGPRKLWKRWGIRNWHDGPSAFLQGSRRAIGDILEWDPKQPAVLPQGFLKELEIVPTLRKRVERLEFEQPDRAPARTLAGLLQQFSSGRAIVSDLFGTLLTLSMSWAIMRNPSLSLTSIAHGFARKSAHDRAASHFFLGKKAGAAFYNVFPPAVHESTVWTVLVFLAAGLTVGAMACTILSDPIRKVLGFHRHRLEVLLDEVERELILLSHKRIRQKLQS